MISVGCDISKGYADVAVFDSHKHMVFKEVQIDDTESGEQQYLSLLDRIRERFPEEQIVVGMENTGGYESNTAYFLSQQKDRYNLEVLVLNPKPIKRFKEMELHLAETDRTAAQYIALYVLSKYPDVKSCFMESPHQRAMKKILKSLDSLKKELARSKNQLEQVCFTVFPEVISFMRSDKPVWLLEILKTYSIPSKLKRAGVQKLMRIPGVTEVKARQMIGLAKNSRGMDNRKEFIPVIKEKTDYLLMLIQKERSMEKLLVSLFREAYPENPLPTIPGVSEYGAAVIMSYIMDVNRFPTPAKVTALFGLDPKVSESGDTVRKRKISKRGISVVRRFLYMQCLCMLSIEGHPIKRHYTRLVSRGFNHYYSIVACMRKLVVIMVALLKSGDSFKMNYADIRKAEEQSQTEICRRKRGMTEKPVTSYSTEAPISAREATRRKNALKRKKEKAPNFKIQGQALTESSSNTGCPSPN